MSLDHASRAAAAAIFVLGCHGGGGGAGGADAHATVDASDEQCSLSAPIPDWTFTLAGVGTVNVEFYPPAAGATTASCTSDIITGANTHHELACTYDYASGSLSLTVTSPASIASDPGFDTCLGQTGVYAVAFGDDCGTFTVTRQTDPCPVRAGLNGATFTPGTTASFHCQADPDEVAPDPACQAVVGICMSTATPSVPGLQFCVDMAGSLIASTPTADLPMLCTEQFGADYQWTAGTTCGAQAFVQTTGACQIGTPAANPWADMCETIWYFNAAPNPPLGEGLCFGCAYDCGAQNTCVTEGP